MDHDIILGQLRDKEERDAIHIAVAPVVAKELLHPGQHIGFEEGSTEMVTILAKTPIGIVDPFLKHNITPGEKFWMLLYPFSITSLRHNWTHPAFEEATKPEVPKRAEPPQNDSKAESEAWLREYACRMNAYLVDDWRDDQKIPGGEQAAFDALISDLKHGELHGRGTDLHGLYDLEDAEDLRWHAENYLGTHINWDNYVFTCSC